MPRLGHRKILERSGEWGSGWKEDISFTLDSSCGRDLIIMLEPKCEDCGTSEDVGYDEDGNELCFDCLFYRESMKGLDEDN